MSSQQATLDAILEGTADAAKTNDRVVDSPETVDWMDYHEFLRISREREAQR